MPSQKLPLDDFYRGRILNFGHRGARKQAPENTLPAFKRAAELGADGVELDVQLSADGVPVIIHDSSVERTTNGRGMVAEKTAAELRELDAGVAFGEQFAGTRIPTLDEVFETLGQRLLFNVELKDFSFRSALAPVVIERIMAHNMASRVLVSSFNPLLLRQVRRLAPEIPIGSLYAPDLPFPLSKSWLPRLVIGRHEAQHPHFSTVDEDSLRRLHARGYRVNVWTVNEPEDIQRMMRLGVDMIISDYPDRVRDVLSGQP